MCHPNEIADLACFLTSSQADYINGSIIRIDGGEVNANSGEFNFLRYIHLVVFKKLIFLIW